jgi:hypothetical protein
LDSLDFVSFDGVQALKHYFTNGEFKDRKLDLPGQLLQLYRKSLLETKKGQEVRAHYLGKALAITSAMSILGGETGLSEKFGVTMQALDLSESWSVIKPCLGKLGKIVSPKAAASMFYLMELTAKRHPEDVRWNTGFLAARITAMAEVLADEGFTPQHIENNIQGILVQQQNKSRESIS